MRSCNNKITVEVSKPTSEYIICPNELDLHNSQIPNQEGETHHSFTVSIITQHNENLH